MNKDPKPKKPLTEMRRDEMHELLFATKGLLGSLEKCIAAEDYSKAMHYANRMVRTVGELAVSIARSLEHEKILREVITKMHEAAGRADPVKFDFRNFPG